VNRDLWVVGSGGHARAVIGAARSSGWTVVGLLDDNPDQHGKEMMGVSVIGGTTELESLTNANVVIGIGDNRVRYILANKFRINWVNVIHSTAWVDPSAALGVGTVLMAGAIVHPMAKIGNHAILNTGCSVDHDGQIGDYSHLAPGARLCGTTEVGEGSFLGSGAIVIQGVKIGKWSQVGAGSVVIRDVPDTALVYGVPAHRKEKLFV
jgi:sugar O-acyltransferase (sialic acid O-acetyltransferase NeuD family)